MKRIIIVLFLAALALLASTNVWAKDYTKEFRFNTKKNEEKVSAIVKCRDFGIDGGICSLFVKKGKEKKSIFNWKTVDFDDINRVGITWSPRGDFFVITYIWSVYVEMDVYDIKTGERKNIVDEANPDKDKIYWSYGLFVDKKLKKRPGTTKVFVPWKVQISQDDKISYFVSRSNGESECNSYYSATLITKDRKGNTLSTKEFPGILEVGDYTLEVCPL